MQIVIDIPEETFRNFMSGKEDDYDISHYRLGLWQGTVLPKGHGRLIDIDNATKDIDTVKKYFTTNILDGVIVGVACSAPTVIEADKESAE